MTIAVTFEIDNVYVGHGTITTIVEAEIPPPPPKEDEDAYEEWEYEHVFSYTGTGRDGDAGYFVKVTQSSNPLQLAPGTEYEFI